MLPGPDEILECPACRAPVAQPTLSSGNTFGATYYTDGYMDAPMLPQPALLVRCPRCAAPFVRPLAIRLGEYDRFGTNLFAEEDAAAGAPDPSWRRARRLAEAQPGDYARILASGQFERELELALRVECWHVGNHARRRLPAAEPCPALSRAEAVNLRALAALLDTANPEQRLMLAELHRELGEFDAALAALAGEFPQELSLAVGRIRTLAEKQEAGVAVLFGGAEG